MRPPHPSAPPSPAVFAPGFRVTARDGAVLLGGLLVTLLGPREFAIIAGTAVGHFFLFCNVFRIRRRPELIWTAFFVVLTTATLATGVPGWAGTVGLSVACAAALIAWDMRHPSYHGVGWRRVNPRLPEWWQAHHGTAVPPAGD